MKKPYSTLLRTPDAAEYLGLQAKTLERWRYEGIGPSYLKLNGSAVRYRISELDRFLEASTRRSTAEGAA